MKGIFELSNHTTLIFWGRTLTEARKSVEDYYEDYYLELAKKSLYKLTIDEDLLEYTQLFSTSFKLDEVFFDHVKGTLKLTPRLLDRLKERKFENKWKSTFKNDLKKFKIK